MQWTFWNEEDQARAMAWHADPENRTCCVCATVHPELAEWLLRCNDCGRYACDYDEDTDKSCSSVCAGGWCGSEAYCNECILKHHPRMLDAEEPLCAGCAETVEEKEAEEQEKEKQRRGGSTR